MTSTKDISFELSMTCLVHISQNFEKRKQSLVQDSNPTVLKNDCPKEPVETTKGKNIDGCVYYHCLILLRSCLTVKFISDIAIELFCNYKNKQVFLN